jgi:hypothetical protein
MKTKSILLVSFLALNAAAQPDLTGRAEELPDELSKETTEKVAELIEADVTARKLEESARDKGVESVKLDKGLLIAIPDKKEDQEKFRVFLEQLKNVKDPDFLEQLKEVNNPDFIKQRSYLFPDGSAKEIANLKIRISVLEAELSSRIAENQALRNQERVLLARIAKAESDLRTVLAMLPPGNGETTGKSAEPTPADQ